MLEKNINWNDIDTWKKRGFCVTSDAGYDLNIPIFTMSRNYIEKYMESEDE